MKTLEKLNTPKGKSYWDKTGIYQKEYKELQEKLVRNEGKANTVHGEMVRIVENLFYDFCNNGNCNVISRETETKSYRCSCCNGRGEVLEYDENDKEVSEQCPECYGNGEIDEEYDGEVVIDDYYQDMIDFLEEKLINKLVIKNLIEFLKDTSKGYSNYKFGDDEMKVYNELMDEIIYQILTTENKTIK